MGNVYLVPGLRSGPRIVEAILTRVPPGSFDAKTDPERFSLREAIAHLADWEPIMLGRMRQAKEQPGSVLVAYDEVQRAIEQNYASTDPLKELKRWAVLREETARWVESIGAGDWDLTVTHPERGKQTLYDLANLLLAHDTYHIDHLTGFLP